MEPSAHPCTLQSFFRALQYRRFRLFLRWRVCAAGEDHRTVQDALLAKVGGVDWVEVGGGEGGG